MIGEPVAKAARPFGLDPIAGNVDHATLGAGTLERERRVLAVDVHHESSVTVNRVVGARRRVVDGGEDALALNRVRSGRSSQMCADPSAAI